MRGKLACSATSRKTANVVALARRSRESRLHVGGHSSHVAPRSCTEGERPPAGVVPFQVAQTDRNQGGAARERGKLACCATSRETASAVALENVPRECRLRVGGHSSHVAPRSCTDGERPAAGAVPFQFRRHITSSAARPARTASLRVLPPPETQPAQWRLRACHVNAGCALQVTARTSHNHLAPKERGLPPVQFYFTAQKPTATSAARRARAASSRM